MPYLDDPQLPAFDPEFYYRSLVRQGHRLPLRWQPRRRTPPTATRYTVGGYRDPFVLRTLPPMPDVIAIPMAMSSWYDQ